MLYIIPRLAIFFLNYCQTINKNVQVPLSYLYINKSFILPPKLNVADLSKKLFETKNFFIHKNIFYSLVINQN